MPVGFRDGIDAVARAKRPFLLQEWKSGPRVNITYSAIRAVAVVIGQNIGFIPGPDFNFGKSRVLPHNNSLQLIRYYN
jgi:hypothetical protein